MQIRKVYHLTDRKNLDKIMVDGLRPLAKNRPKELEIADVAFDIAANRLGIPQRRKGLFAWPTLEMAMGGFSNQTAIVEVETHAQTSLVLHQAWIDLAWGMVEGIFARIRPGFKELEADELLERMKIIRIYEGYFTDVLLELGKLYWTTGVLLADYNEEKAKLLNGPVTEQMARFQGLMPGLGHEAALGVEIIEPKRIRAFQTT